MTEGSPTDTTRESGRSRILAFAAESEVDAGGETEVDTGFVTDAARETEVEQDNSRERNKQQTPTLDIALPKQDPETESEELIAEVVFFDYGVAVFYGFDEVQERNIIDDLANAGIFRRTIKEIDWEIEEFHFAVRSTYYTDLTIYSAQW